MQLFNRAAGSQRKMACANLLWYWSKWHRAATNLPGFSVCHALYDNPCASSTPYNKGCAFEYSHWFVITWNSTLSYTGFTPFLFNSSLMIPGTDWGQCGEKLRDSTRRTHEHADALAKKSATTYAGIADTSIRTAGPEWNPFYNMHWLAKEDIENQHKPTIIPIQQTWPILLPQNFGSYQTTVTPFKHTCISSMNWEMPKLRRTTMRTTRPS